MISTKHNCVFVHIPKTGGSSVRAVFKVKDNTSHSTARKYIEKLGEDVYRGMFSFAFVRNPFDRMVSLYTQPGGFERPRTKLRPKWSFADWLTYMEEQIRGHKFGKRGHIFGCQLDSLVDHAGVVAVNHIGRFENLTRDWKVVCRSVELGRGNLPVIARSKGRRPYQEYYDEKSKGIVAKLYKRDLEHFRYEF